MGGAAFKEKVRRIQKEEIPDTIRWLAGVTDLDKGYLLRNMLGSAGKSETSGDIDLNMDEKLFDKAAILAKVKAVLGDDNVKDWTHVNQIFTCVPIKGDPANGFIQVDFMFGNRVWQEFSYYSPGPYSQYKGLFRTELIKAAVAFCSDWVLMEDGQMIARVGPTFFHDKGCVWRYRHRAIRKDGKGRVQALTELSKEDFFKLYPYAQVASKEVIDTPEGVAELIFGDSRRTYAFPTYEILVRKLQDFYSYSGNYGSILKIFEERLNSLKVDIPEAIQNEILAANRSTR